MKLFKKNQVIIYVIALMLVTAGYLNYTTNESTNSVETSLRLEGDDTQIADIGDATLVNSNDVMQNNGESAYQENTTTDKSNQIENDTYNQTENTDTSNSTSVQTNANALSEYFVKSKLERDTMYSQMLETYENVLNSSNALETQKQSATDEITKINEIKNKIMICENLIKTKGFENNVIFVNGNSISIIIEAEEIKTEEIAQIQNIISREMNVEIENIHISTK